MTKTTEPGEPGDESPSGECDLDTLPDDEAEALAGYQTRPEVDAEIATWRALGRNEQMAALRKLAAGPGSASPEALVYLCCEAQRSNDLRMLNLAFEALSKRVTPLLLARAWGKTLAERQEQVQEILLLTFVDIQKGRAQFAQSHFAGYAARRAISLYRAECSRFESMHQHIWATDDVDPLDALPTRVPSAEARALLARSLDKLSKEQRAVFTQFHIFQLTQEEIAAQRNVSTRWVRSLLRDAEALIGFAGDDNDR